MLKERKTVSVQFNHSVVSDSLQPHGLQHARLLCSSPTPGACSNSCPLSWWCHPTISSSAIPFSSCLQSFPELGSFPMSQFFTSGGQSIGVSASTSVLPMNIQDWFPLGWIGWIPWSPRDSQESSPTLQFKSISSSALSFLYNPALTSIRDHWKILFVYLFFGVRDLSSLPRDPTSIHPPAVDTQSLIHSTAKEVLRIPYLICIIRSLTLNSWPVEL